MADSNTRGPIYYKRGSLDVWDFIRDQGLNFHLGNAIKYICRAGYKGDITEDLRKAIHYLENELENQIKTESGRFGVPQGLSCKQQSYSLSTEYTADFDR